MKRLPISFPKAEDIPSLLDQEGIPFMPVATINWKEEYPYCPKMSVRMALTNDTFLIHYQVDEQAVLARYTKDCDQVWTDSCAECFLLGADKRTYFNMECSCIGTLLIGQGEGRKGRHLMSPDMLQTVGRWSSLGRKPFGLIEKATHWELALSVPYSIFGEESPLFNNDVIFGNVYKCGDDLPTPHYVSLFPISIESPDFHRPEFFQAL